MSDRDRDVGGRARSARPRDGLGRPLPYGADGVERAPEGVRRSVEQTVDEAQHLLDAGRPFHAHEVFEDAWKGEPGPGRELWRGLAQLAVGLTHAARGNARGAASLLRRGADVIEPFAHRAEADATPVGAAPVDAPPVDITAVDVAPVDVAPVDVAPVDVAPVDVAPVDVAPVDVAPVDVTPVDVTPVDVAPVDVAPVDVAGLVGWARTAAVQVEAGQRPTVPVLRRKPPQVLAQPTAQ